MDRRQALRTAFAAGTSLAGLAGCGAVARTAPRPTPTGTPTTAPNTTAPNTTAAALPPEVTHGPRDRPALALTFHGQGDPALADRLLTRLESAGARVTVMAVGTWLAAEPAMAKRIVDGGHELGNHTEHHLDITAMDASGAYAEIEACARTLDRLTGSTGRWFRPSQTRHATALIRREAQRAGYPTCLSYDVDSLDYTDPPVATVVDTTLAAATNGSIVSMHLGHPVTIAAIGPILDGLHRRGLRPVTMSALVAP
jgi:peptidoglycan/xylan/chitin deacetylase (PgdA/CDA1 family)